MEWKFAHRERIYVLHVIIKAISKLEMLNGWAFLVSLAFLQLKEMDANNKAFFWDVLRMDD